MAGYKSRKPRLAGGVKDRRDAVKKAVRKAPFGSETRKGVTGDYGITAALLVSWPYRRRAGYKSEKMAVPLCSGAKGSGASRKNRRRNTPESGDRPFKYNKLLFFVFKP